MNKSRRTRLEKAQTLIIQACEAVEEVLEEEQDALDNIPENLAGSERYNAIESAVDSLQEAVDSLQSAQDSITEATNR